MRCIITKWIIDRRGESKRPLPGPVSKHMDVCADCRAYGDMGRLLSMPGPDPDIPGLDALNQRIIHRIKAEGSENHQRGIPKFRFAFAVAAALIVFVISAGYFLVIDGKGTPDKPLPEIRISLEKIYDVKNLNGLLARAESPMLREAEMLKESFNSARNYLRSVMDFRIPGIRE